MRCGSGSRSQRGARRGRSRTHAEHTVADTSGDGAADRSRARGDDRPRRAEADADRARRRRGVRDRAQGARRGGADYVKTSTGFGPEGATVEDVRLLRQTVGDKLGVKASGGIRTLDEALAMIEAGASRLGTSSTSAILAELRKRRGED